MSEDKYKAPMRQAADGFIRDLAGRTSPLLDFYPGGELAAPVNAVTGRGYSGLNRVLLSGGGADPRWFTEKQAREAGYQPDEKAQGRQAVYWEFKETRAMLDDRGRPVLDEDGRAVTETVERDRPALRFYRLYHASELRLENGRPLPAYKAPVKPFGPDRLENIIRGSGLTIEHDQRNLSFYRAKDDSVHLMPPDAYPDNQVYAAELLKALARASRRQDRLDRPCGPLGSEVYAKEELRIALSSMMMAQDLGLPFVRDNNESYAKVWGGILEKDPCELARACRDAERIREYVMSLGQNLETERERPGPEQMDLERVVINSALMTTAAVSPDELIIILERVKKDTDRAMASPGFNHPGNEVAARLIQDINRQASLGNENAPTDLLRTAQYNIAVSGHIQAGRSRSLEEQSALKPVIEDYIAAYGLGENELALVTGQKVDFGLDAAPGYDWVIDTRTDDVFYRDRSSPDAAWEACPESEYEKVFADEVITLTPAIVLGSGRILTYDGREHGQAREQTMREAGKAVEPDRTLEVLNDMQLAIEEPSIVKLTRIVEGMDENHPSLASDTYFSAVLHDIKEIGGEIAASGHDEDHPELAEKWQAIGGMIDDLEKRLLQQQKSQDQSREAGPEIPDPLYTITAFRRVGTADGEQPRPWMEAEDDGKALFFGVQSNKDGSIAATYSVDELRCAEEKMSALNRASAMNYAPPAPLTSTEKVELNVHYMHKAIAKELGATWDNGKKSWCARPGVDLDKLSRWIPASERQRLAGLEQANASQADKVEAKPEPASEKTLLNVPFKDKEEAKGRGAKWSPEDKLWYAPAGTDLGPLARWIPENTPEPVKNMSPAEEFGQALEADGLILDGPPIMDGEMHRVRVVGGRPGSLDGAYFGHLDGRPNGMIYNHKEGTKTKFLATGQVLTEEQKNALKIEAAEKLAQREKDRQAMEIKAIDRARAKWNKSLSPSEQFTHPYLKAKSLEELPLKNIREDGRGNLMVPLYDAEGVFRSMQTVSPEGQKQFEKGCPKTGNMHVIGDGKDGKPDGLKNARPPQIYISEGYATGASVFMATENPVVVAFDANNLKAVAMAVREILPEANITICADNDHTKDKNVGLEKAKDAAQAVGGEVVAPEFTPEEMDRGLTDFNDLHQSRGLGAVRQFLGQRRSLGRAASQVKASVSSNVKSAGMGL